LDCNAGTSYSVGATESQCEYPFKYKGKDIECVKVSPVEWVIVEYL